MLRESSRRSSGRSNRRRSCSCRPTTLDWVSTASLSDIVSGSRLASRTRSVVRRAQLDQRPGPERVIRADHSEPVDLDLIPQEIGLDVAGRLPRETRSLLSARGRVRQGRAIILDPNPGILLFRRGLLGLAAIRRACRLGRWRETNQTAPDSVKMVAEPSACAKLAACWWSPDSGTRFVGSRTNRVESTGVGLLEQQRSAGSPAEQSECG